MNRLNRWLSLGLVLTLGFLVGMLGFSLWDKMPSTVERIAWSPEAQWIAPQDPSYRFYARRTFYLADTAQAAWLQISADDDFILYVNGKDITREISTLNNSLGLGSRLSESSQNFNDSVEYHVNTGAFYLLTNARDWKLTTYIDLTSYLRPGKNTIALAIQKSRQNPRVVVQGAVYPVQEAAPINISTGATPWQISTLSENRQELQWFDPDFPDQSWPEAKAVGSVQEATYSRLSRHLFDRFLQGAWIAGTESPQGEVWLRGTWQIPQKRLSRAFIRFAGDGEYALLINGLLVNRYGVSDSNQLHMYEVTNFLKTGDNTLAVRLARPLDPDWSSARKGSLTQNSSLGFFLDGWVETKQNSITAPIATDSTWSALTQPISGWTEGSEDQGQPAIVLESPNPQEFQRKFEGNAYLLNYPDYLLHQSLWQLGAIDCALICAWGLGWFWLGRRKGWWDSFSAGAGLLLPGTLFLIGIGLLKHRYAESELGLLFVQPQSTPLILLGFVGVVSLTLLWNQIGRRPQNHYGTGLETLPRWGVWFLLGGIACVSLSLATGGIANSWSLSIFLVSLGFGGIVVLTLLWSHVRWQFQDGFNAVFQAWPSWGQWFLLVLIVSIGFGLRVYDLGFQNLDTDESISFDAIRGILHTGAPEATSGIWYTRSPFYHYMVALWLRLVGDSAVNVRFLSALWGTAALVFAFILARKITGKVWVALVVTALLAIDPWQLWYSRFIRFYQVLQFMSLVSFWSFYKGFIEREGRRYQYLFFVVLTLTLLSQEVTITLLPCFLIGFLFFYRPFRLSVDWPILAGSFMVMAIYAYDVIFFSIRCLTPWIALGSSTESYLKPHLRDVAGFIACLFVGPTRMYTLFSFFFFLGFVYFLKRRNAKLIFFFSVVLIYLVILTLLLYQITPRYTFPIYPLFLILSVHSAGCLMESLGRRFELILKGSLPLKHLALACTVLLLVSNIEPARVLAGYQDAFVRRNIQVFEYIRDRREPEDVVVSPTAPGAAIILGHLDYTIPGVLPLDNLYSHDGRVIERVGRGVVISNLDQMSHVLEKAKRVWIHLDDAKENSYDSEVLEYLQTIGKPVMETFGARLRLWQQDDGLLPRIPNQGKDLGNY